MNHLKKYSARFPRLTCRSLCAVTVVAALFASLGMFNRAQADHGDLDMGFGSEGKIVTSLLTSLFETSDSELKATAVQSDGKIIAVGSNNYFTFDLRNTSTDFVITRYNSDGTLDAGFRGGKIITDVSEGQDLANAVAIQSDGKIVVAGFSIIEQKSAFALVRYNGDGTLDESFGNRGRVLTDFSDKSARALALSVRQDGQIIVAGPAYSPNLGRCDSSNVEFMAIARYNSDGSLDSSFGTGGKVVSDIFGQPCSLRFIGFRRDGKIVGAGAFIRSRIAPDVQTGFGLVRYNSDGSIDESFGSRGDGKMVVPFEKPTAEIRAIAFTESDRIVAVGTISDNSVFYRSAKIAIVRFEKDGLVDPGFGEGGVISDFFGSFEHGNALVIQPDDKVIIAGAKDFSVYSESIGDFLLARYNSDGTLDTEFGDGGKVTADFGRQDVASSLMLQTDGSILVGGYRRIQYLESRQTDFALARFESILPSDFNIALERPSLEASRKQVLHIPVNINRIRGFSGNVAVTAPDVKPLKMKFSKSVISTTGEAVVFKLKIKRGIKGSHQLTFRAQDESGRVRQITLALNVR